jgi:hypothetical protein
VILGRLGFVGNTTGADLHVIGGREFESLTTGLKIFI